MTKSFPKIIGALLEGGIILSASFSALAESVPYSNYDSPFSFWGSGKSETYDVGMYLSGPDFEGIEISSISFPVVTDPEISGYSIWLSTELALQGGEYIPNVASVETVPDGGVITINLDEPYLIKEGGVYVGYSFNVGKRETDEQKKPVAVITGQEDIYGHGIYVHSSRTYGKWTESVPGKDSFLPFDMTLEGIGKYAASLTMPESLNIGAGKDINVEICLANKGASPVNSVDIEYTLSGGTHNNVHIDLPEELPNRFRASATFDITLPANEDLGHQSMEAGITSVNGFKNEALHSSARTELDVWSFVPVHRPLFEEYTGTGCGYCPRGEVALNKLAELFKDEFVGVAYHCTDVMSIFKPEEYPNPAPAIPTLWIDRVRETDPYFGDRMEANVFATDKIWKSIASRFTPVDINLNLKWADDRETAIEATSSMTFVKELQDQNLRMIYLLVADGLKGNDGRWFQTNTYSGQTGKWPSDLDIFVNSSNPIVDMAYNHVVVFSTSPEDENAALPSSVGRDETLSHTTTLNLENAVNIDGESLIQDKSKLSVVAIIFDADKGEAVNCIKAAPGASGISGPSIQSKEIASKIYFNSCGIKTSNLVPGELYIETIVYSDGTRSANKVIYNR